MRAEIIKIFNDVWPTITIVGCVIIIMRITYLIKNGKRNFSLHEEIINIAFLVYLIILFRLVSSQEISNGGGINLSLFSEITRYKYGSVEFTKQVFGNIILFIPLGYFASRYCKLNGFFSIIIVSILSSLSIETVQYYIGRSADIDDILLNTIGGIIGFLLYIGIRAIRNRLPKFFKKNWFKSLITLIIIAIIVLYVLGII